MKGLRRTLASIVLAAPLGAGCLPGSCPPPKMTEETVPLPAMPDPTVMMDIADCQADPTNAMSGCFMLCSDIFFQQHGYHEDFDTCELLTDANGAQSVHYIAVSRCVGGRRPAGYRRGRPCGHPVGAYLAQQAELEAASVRAFEDLLADLVAHGAPIALRRATVRAAADEVRHARICDALARRHGVTPRYAPIAAARARMRRELAIDNAVEGCVRETFGATVAGYQARSASDPAIRSAMQRIWADEAKHAALSWRLHRWLAPQLSARDRRAVTSAALAARAELADAPAEHAELHRVAGLPEPAAARTMLAALDAQVWTALA